jgi:glucosylceramidase
MCKPHVLAGQNINMAIKKLQLLVLAFGVLFIAGDCSKKGNGQPAPAPTPPPAGGEVEVWLTKGDQSALLQKQSTNLSFGKGTSGFPNIVVDTTATYQTVDGFGYTLTGSSAYLIMRMDAASRAGLLGELFGPTGIGVSYLRISLGASDLSPSVFSYNDLPTGQTDTNLVQFSLAKDTVELIPLLQEILAVNPGIKIMASPWSPPVWMKDNGSSIGGNLLPQYYAAYARYFVKYIQAMQAKGIRIDAVTVQNEPQHGGNNPSMVMSATQQANFVKNNLGPAFQASGIATKIVIWDHNCDNPGYPISILNDAAAKPFVNGSAFHLYAGDISALATVQAAHPDKALYFTEQWTGALGSFDGDFKWHIKNVIIGSMRNWSRNALEWNLAADATYGPHTPGGCTECKGALTLIGSSATRNVSYYIIAQAAKFVPPGSVRIASNLVTDLPNVAFKTPSGKKVLLVLNDGAAAIGFNIAFNNKEVFTSLPAGAAATYIW